MGVFDLDSKRKRVEELEAEINDPDIWKDRKVAEEKLKESGKLKNWLERFDELESGIADLSTSQDENRFFELRRMLRAFEVEQFFKGKYDSSSAVLSIFPGAGGEDAADWARMLGEMYLSYAAQRGWKTRIIDDGVIEIDGDYVYGFLKKETGVHRLVRISPFSPKQLRHTSFALIEVVPELPKLDVEKFEIPEDEMRVEFYRSSGPGGQNVNKVETAVRIIHTPTGITAASQAERSQAQNRERALTLLKSKLVKIMEETQASELGSLRTKVKPEWGSQIRSYVLNPYKLVKDHRTEVETTQADAVLSGALDKFIEAEIQS